MPVLIGKRTVLALKVMNTIFLAVSVLALPYPYGITFGAVKKKREAHLVRDLCHFRLRDIFSLVFFAFKKCQFNFLPKAEQVQAIHAVVTGIMS